MADGHIIVQDLKYFSPASVVSAPCFRPSEVSWDGIKFSEWLEADNSPVEIKEEMIKDELSTLSLRKFDAKYRKRVHNQSIATTNVEAQTSCLIQ